MTYDDWRATKPICPTCGKVLTSSEDSFRTCMRRFGRPPLHCKGHTPRPNKQVQKAEWLAFLALKKVCACGCGEIIQPNYRAYVVSMGHYGRPPNRIQTHRQNGLPYKHNHQPKIDKSRIKLNGCTLIRADHGRCEKSFHCEHYESCRDAAESRHWGGWRTT